MSADWWYSQNGKRIGPVSLDAMQRAAAAGGLLPTDFVWQQGMMGWVQAGTVKGLMFSSPPPLPPQPQTSSTEPPDFDALGQGGGIPPIVPGHRQNYRDNDVGFTLRTRNCTLAYVAFSLVCASFLTAFLLLLPGIVCGHIALDQCKRDPHLTGRSWAVAALIVGYIVVGVVLLLILCFFGLLATH